MNQAAQKKIVLVVDDSSEALGMINEFLDRPDIMTLVALGGEQAVRIAATVTPDVILLDAVMPGMDGFDTCKKIKEKPELKHVPVIFMTGLSDTDSIVRGFDVGGIDYLTKPVQARELLARIDAHLAQARATLSAHVALDTAGQSVFLVEPSGNILWSTPKALHILDEIEASGRQSEFVEKLLDWLARPRDIADTVRIHLGEHGFVLYFFGNANGDGSLVRLVDDLAVDERVILMENFGVTKRESEVYLWLARGKTNREIAEILSISPRTVNKHLEQLFRKLGVLNRASAASLAAKCLQRALG